MRMRWPIQVEAVPGYEQLAISAYNVYSQFGEDGIVDMIFRCIGYANMWAFECGAADGLWLSNTARLKGWTCVLVEPDPHEFMALQQNRPDAIKMMRHLGPEFGIDLMLQIAGAPQFIDLVVIDIDGDDVAAIEAMHIYKPRVMIVEFDRAFKLDGDALIRDDINECKSDMEALMSMKGYVTVARTRVNLICVRQDLAGELKNKGPVP